jgi:hypothetical protein
MIESSSQIDEACECRTKNHASISHRHSTCGPNHTFLVQDESLVNAAFYTLLTLIGLAVIGVDTSALLIAFGTSLVGIGFIIGPASSRYFEVSTHLVVRA